MRTIARVSLILILTARFAYAQQSRTFNVEELSQPNTALITNTYDQVLQNLIQVEYGVDAGKIPYGIIAKSKMPEQLVAFGYSSFFRGMYTAYADHRPFTLSPDMIWLLINQGFANHVNYNSADLRSMFVKFEGKQELTVRHNGTVDLHDPKNPWGEVFAMLGDQIAQHTGAELTKTLVSDFSTTTMDTRIASQITMMNGLNTYFDYSMIMGCGIPQITLEGSTADWVKVLGKTEALRKYKLDWWIDEIQPVLKQFVAASKGNVDKQFWQGMFKYHRQNTKCAPGTIIDGWIVKFYPYKHNGKRNDLKTIYKTAGGDDQMPDEIVKVNLNCIDPLGKKVPLELWAGFVGLEQNNKTFSLKPQIGWMIRQREPLRQGLLTRLQKQNAQGGLILKVETVPPEVMNIGPIKALTIFFKDKITIPDALAKVKIDKLYLNGETTAKDTERIRKLFPDTKVVFSGKEDVSIDL